MSYLRYICLFVGGSVSYLRYLCLFTYSDVQCILCCVAGLFFFVSCTLCCQFLWIVYFLLPLPSLSFIYIDYNKQTFLTMIFLKNP